MISTTESARSEVISSLTRPALPKFMVNEVIDPILGAFATTASMSAPTADSVSRDSMVTAPLASFEKLKLVKSFADKIILPIPPAEIFPRCSSMCSYVVVPEIVAEASASFPEVNKVLNWNELSVTLEIPSTAILVGFVTK